MQIETVMQYYYTTIRIARIARPGGSVVWSIILYTKGLRVQSPVRVYARGLVFLSHINVSLSLSLPPLPLSLKSINIFSREDFF